MNTLIIGAFLLTIFGSPTTVYASTTPPQAQILPTTDTSTKEAIKERIKHYASLYGVSENTLNKVIKCESNYNPAAVGDNGKSFGLVQIMLSAHPDITHKQALDINFSISYLAKNISKGNGNIWTCYRQL